MQIQIKRGDIASQADIEVVVNSANANLRSGSGVAGAIHAVAGPELELHCAPFVPLDFGRALLTPGFNLPNPWIIHVRAAHYFNHDSPQQVLKSALQAMFQLVREKSFKSLAVPAIGTGVFKFPYEEAARITADVFVAEAESTDLQLVRFCIPDLELANVYLDKFSRCF